MFQHTAARRRLFRLRVAFQKKAVSTHSRPKAAELRDKGFIVVKKFQHTAARRRLKSYGGAKTEQRVSTHSRPKAAVTNHVGLSMNKMFQHTAARRRLPCQLSTNPERISFNTQPPEGGCPYRAHCWSKHFVSTHSRPKAAGFRQPI